LSFIPEVRGGVPFVGRVDVLMTRIVSLLSCSGGWSAWMRKHPDHPLLQFGV